MKTFHQNVDSFSQYTAGIIQYRNVLKKELMIPSFGWSTVGTEQNDPDTVNNLLFGHIEATPSYVDIFNDQMDDSSSFGLLGNSKSDDNGMFALENHLPLNESIQIPEANCR